MKIKGVIGTRFEQKKGVSKTTGKEWIFQDMIFGWDEAGLNTTCTHDLRVTCSQDLNQQRLAAAAASFEEVEVNLSFSTRESKSNPGTFYNEIRIWLPKEFLQQEG